MGMVKGSLRILEALVRTISPIIFFILDTLSIRPSCEHVFTQARQPRHIFFLSNDIYFPLGFSIIPAGHVTEHSPH